MWNATERRVTAQAGQRATNADVIILGGRFGEEPTTLSWQRLDRFAEAGGRTVDTAHSYAGGGSELVIGQWMRANAQRLVVVDKIGHPDERGALDLSLPTLRREAAESRRRLGVDVIDVLLLHRDSSRVAVEDAAAMLAALVDEGIAARIGVSNWPAHRLDQLVTALAAYDHVPVISYQHSLAAPAVPLWPGARHAGPAVRRVRRRHGLPMLAWAAQARGFFTGRTEPPSPDGPDPFDSEVNRARRERCRVLAREMGSRPETVALAWLLHQRGTRAIVGPRSIPELDASLAATEIELDATTIRWLAEGPM